LRENCRGRVEQASTPCIIRAKGGFVNGFFWTGVRFRISRERAGVWNAENADHAEDGQPRIVCHLPEPFAPSAYHTFIYAAFVARLATFHNLCRELKVGT